MLRTRETANKEHTGGNSQPAKDIANCQQRIHWNTEPTHAQRSREALGEQSETKQILKGSAQSELANLRRRWNILMKYAMNTSKHL